MDPRHDDQPHVTGRGFLCGAALAGLLLFAIRLCDDTRWIDDHARQIRASVETPR